MLFSSLNTIYLTLIGLSDLFIKNEQECSRDQQEYYDIDSDDELLAEALEEENSYTFKAKDF